MQKEVVKIYKEIYTSILKLIPEKWEKVYLYASVLKNLKGEMYFYYFPKKIIKSKPINCYEIPEKFEIDENTYNNKLKELYLLIKKIKSKVEWTNVTISIDKKVFKIEYHFNDLRKSKYTDEERHIIWQYNYLNLSIDSLNKKEQKLVLNYKEESNINPVIITEEIKDFEKEEIKNPILKI